MSINSKQTSKKIAHLAGKVMNETNSSQVAKSLAASLIAQTNTSKQTGKEMEACASKVLQSEKYSELTKALAASVLSQSNKNR